MGIQGIRPRYIAIYSPVENGDPVSFDFVDWKDVSNWLQEKWKPEEVEDYQLKIYSLELVNPKFILDELERD
jgi:uncharacterized protein YfaT (DUF1175 family)